MSLYKLKQVDQTNPVLIGSTALYRSNDVQTKPIEPMTNYILIREYSDLMEHKKWTEQIPYISFPAEWKVKIVPPFGGAVIRFYVMQENAKVSAYLDCYDNIGHCGEPYWEIYPYKSDVFRCGMYETDKLLEAIKNSISDQLNQPNQ